MHILITGGCGYTGTLLTNVTKDISESLGITDNKGAFVSSLNPEGPSKKAGIQEGDVILKFNNIKITKMLDLPRLVGESDKGSLAKVEIWRKNKIIVIIMNVICYQNFKIGYRHLYILSRGTI